MPETVSTLPATADGVPITPGMTLYYFAGYQPASPNSSKVGKVSETCWYQEGATKPVTKVWPEGSPFFASEATALRYRANFLREVADEAESLALQAES